jgi:hypothetical protein
MELAENLMGKKLRDCPQLFSSRPMRDVLFKNWKKVLYSLPQIAEK